MPTSLSRREMLAAAGAASLAPMIPPMRQPDSTSHATQRRRELYSLLGRLPPRDRPIQATKRDEGERDGYILETWDLDLNGIEIVPADWARPRTLAGRAPAVLFNHSHGGGYKIGKKEFI